MSNFVIDSMVESDFPRVRQIYLEGISTGEATFETDAPDWEKWDGAHLPFGRLVARAGETIRGWAALSAVSERCVYAGVAETSVYVDAQCRGRGVGSALLHALVDIADRHGV